MSEHDDLLRRLRRLGTTPIEPERRAADLAAMASAAPGDPTTPAARRAPLWRPKVRLAAAFLAGLLVGSTGLAAADALPDPAQHVAHQALSTVGVSVPDPVRYHGPECGPEEKGNHGAYVRDDPSLAQSECGKPVHASGSDDGETSGKSSDKADKAQGKGHAADPDGCHGKPPWAGNKVMTPDQRAAAQAERAARCGTSTDEAEADEDKAVPDTAPVPETSTTEGSTTTSEEPSTTVPDTATTTTALSPTTSTTG